MSRWKSCNVLQAAPDANRLWQFDAKNFALNRKISSAAGQPVPPKFAAKSWTSLWQPKLNIAWLPPEHVFLRVVELPKSTFEETLSMVELQLEKLSPMPATQIVWTFQILPQAPAENLQTVVVVIAERRAVEEFLGKLETQGYLPDRLEAPMLDQLQIAPGKENDAAGQNETAGAVTDGEVKPEAWVFPTLLNGQSAARVAWWSGGSLRNLSFIVLPSNGDRAKSLKEQIGQQTWAGELEGWLTTEPKWRLVADGATADEWKTFLHESLAVPVQMERPLPPQELAAQTARRAAASSPPAVLLPPEFSTRYQQQFVDRLWLHGLLATGILYAVCVAIYFCATTFLGFQTDKLEGQVAGISGSYTNALQMAARYNVLKERQDLKFAALDCLKIVADDLPPGITLQRFSFANGEQLTLSGTATQDQINTLFDFNSAMQKATLNGQPMFAVEGGSPVSPRTAPNGTVTWNFSLKLKNSGEKTP